MESRNVKVIDEHGIDRDAYVICGLNFDASDYVLYSIERDGDNDNLFVSKIIKNIDGTANMVNIEDSMEKNKVNDIVKELITYSVKNEADRTTGMVKLDNGKEIAISGVLFNKEQNINVGKTYITTVKKATAKVSEDFYKVEEVKKEESAPVVETPTSEVVAPVVENPEPVVEEMPTVELAPEPVLPEVTPDVAPVVEPILPVAPVAEKAEEPMSPPEPSVVEIPKVEPPIVEPVIPTMPEPVAEPVIPVEEVKSEPEVAPVEPILPVEPVIPVAPIPAAIPSEVPTPLSVNEEVPVAPVANEPKLLFDGSQETNLNQALDEVNVSKVLPTDADNVESLREFGIDKADSNDVSVDIPTESTGKVLRKSKGFANNKFFVVVAITFFMASCVFLGYEAFKYFQMVR